MQPHPEREPRDRDRAFVDGLSRRLLGDWHDAQDIAQETWLAYLQSGVRISSIRSFLATVARCRTVNLLRTEDSRRQREREIARGDRTAPGADEVAVWRSVERMVFEALSALDPPYRTVLQLRFYEDLSPGEIGAYLGIPKETVRTRLRRGLALLREDLDRRSSGDRSHWLRVLLPLGWRRARRVARWGLALAGSGALILGALVRPAPLEGTAIAPEARRTSRPADRRGAVRSDALPPAPWSRAPRGELFAERDLRVVVREDGRVLPDVRIAATWAGGETALRSGTDGVARARLPLGRPVLIRAQATASTGPGEVEHTLEASASQADEILIAVPAVRSLTGRVLDAGGRPAGGVELGLWATHDPGKVATEQPVRRCTTNPEGHYAFHAVPPTFLVSASPGPQRAVSVAEVALPIVSGLAMPPGTYSQDLRTSKGTTLQGKVVDVRGEGVPGARVEFLPIHEQLASRHQSQGLSVDWPRPRRTTASDGSFRVDHLPSGEWRVEAGLERDAIGSREIRLPSSEDVTVRLVPGCSLEVSVVGPRGEPVEGATVALQESIPHERLGRTVQVEGRVERERTDERGRVVFRGLAPDGGALVAVEEGGKTFAIVATRLRAEGAALRLVQPDARQLVGRLRHADGRPVADALVELAAEPLALPPAACFAAQEALSTIDTLRTDPSGAFRFEGIPAVPLHLRATVGSAVSTYRLDGTDHAVDLVLPAASERTAVVQGQVRDAETGRPLAGARVRGFGVESGFRLLDLTADDGRYRLDFAECEEVRLVVKASGRAGILARVLPDAEGGCTRDLQLYRSTDVPLRILDRNGAPIPLATVEAFDENGEQVIFPIRRNEQSTRLIADRRGDVSLIDLPVGAVALKVFTPFTRRPAVFEIDTSLDENGVHELRLEHVDLADAQRKVAVRVVEVDAGPFGWSEGEPPVSAKVRPGSLELAVRDSTGALRLDVSFDPTRPDGGSPPAGEVARAISMVRVAVPEGWTSHGAQQPLLLAPAGAGWDAPGGREVFCSEVPFEALPCPRAPCQLDVTTPDGSRWSHWLEAGTRPVALTLRLPARP